MTERRSDPRFRALLATPLARALATARGDSGAWLVGGATRDAALGRGVADLDVVVEGDGEAMAAALARDLGGRLVRLGGDRFGALRVVAREGEIDLWPLAGATLESDLARRDFTINAIAVDLADGAAFDPFHGLDDLAARRLRTTRATVFEEDPLRVVRLARFAATLEDFTAEAATVELARAAASRLREVPGERIRTELERLWSGAGFAIAQQALEQSGTWPELWRPGADAVAASPTAVPVATVLDLDLAESPQPPPIARVAAGHALAARGAAGPDAADVIERLADRRALPVADARGVRRLLELVLEPPPPDAGGPAWLLHRAGDLQGVVFALASALATEEDRPAWRESARDARRQLAQRGGAILDPRPLLDGVEIGRLLGVGPGTAVGAAVRRLREAQVRGEVSTRGEAEALLLGRGLRSDCRPGSSGAD